MLSDFHWIRSTYLWLYLPYAVLLWRVWVRNPSLRDWSMICDPHLLTHLVVNQKTRGRAWGCICLFLSLALVIFSLAGPTWSRLPVPTYQRVMPRVVVLDLSSAMLETDLKPNRLARAKFKLHDLFSLPDQGQTGLIAYTKEPFVVSPLTSDARTMDAWVNVLNPSLMPVQGQNLSGALTRAQQLIEQTGVRYGQVLVLTAQTPDESSIHTAARLQHQGIEVSVLPMVADQAANWRFKPFARAGGGRVFTLNNDTTDLKAWLSKRDWQAQFLRQGEQEIPVWRDQGRWFLIPALLLFLPCFQRGWLLRMLV